METNEPAGEPFRGAGSSAPWGEEWRQLPDPNLRIWPQESGKGLCVQGRCPGCSLVIQMGIMAW